MRVLVAAGRVPEHSRKEAPLLFHLCILGACLGWECDYTKMELWPDFGHDYTRTAEAGAAAMVRLACVTRRVGEVDLRGGGNHHTSYLTIRDAHAHARR